jgi:hypothetical protein
LALALLNSPTLALAQLGPESMVIRHIKTKDRLLVWQKSCAERVSTLEHIKVEKKLIFPESDSHANLNLVDLFYKTGAGRVWWVLFCDEPQQIQDFVIEKLGANLLEPQPVINHPPFQLVRMVRKEGPVFEGNDLKRKRLEARLIPIASALGPITDIQSHPEYKDHVFVAIKNGELKACNLLDGNCTVLLSVDTANISELGFLGIAFHPQFKSNRLIYLRYDVESSPQKYKNRLSELKLEESGLKKDDSYKERIILEVEQPTTEHSGGQIAFGSDGYLYVALGDGGSPTDARKLSSFRGKILRIDINSRTSKSDKNGAYQSPSTNPFLGKDDARPEIWAWGFRNPWRFSFDEKDRMWVADVGENQYEELNIAEKGKDHGWNIKEGKACFRDAKECATLENDVEPFLVYGRDDGNAIIGGYVYENNDISELHGKYIFGDGVSGRIWALDSSVAPTKENPPLSSLGRWPLFITTFGRDASGRVYVGSLSGELYRISN